MPDDWLLLDLAAPPDGEVHLFVDALRRCGARSVERAGGRFEALFPDPGSRDAIDRLVAEVGSAVRASTRLADPDVGWRRQTRAEWAARWRSEQAVARVSRRILVAPVGVPLGDPASATSAAPARAPSPGRDVADDDVVVRLDPGVAFGTAEHPTTRACLALLDARVRPGDRILDVGTGSGILAVAAALLGAAHVRAMEVDPVSCEAARRNVEVNDVADRVMVEEREVAPADLRRVGRYSGVVVNIESRVSAPLVPMVPAALRPGGWLILSGVVGGERADAVAAAEAAGLGLVEEKPERSWWTGAFEMEPSHG